MLKVQSKASINFLWYISWHWEEFDITQSTLHFLYSNQDVTTVDTKPNRLDFLHSVWQNTCSSAYRCPNQHIRSMLEALMVDSASSTSISTSCWELFCPLIDCAAWLILTKRSTWFFPNVASIFRWLYVKQPGHHDWCRAHARRRVGHSVLSLGPVALHQTALQEIHLWAASPWWVSACRRSSAPLISAFPSHPHFFSLVWDRMSSVHAGEVAPGTHECFC